MEIKGINKELITGTMDNARDSILQVEKLIGETENSYVGDSERCPLKHSFSDGIYVREIHIPAGEIIVGKLHKHEHPNFLMKGIVHVFTEGNLLETLTAPCSMISPAGTKRTLYAETDLIWITVHSNPTNTTNLDRLEAEVIAENFLEYDKFLAIGLSKNKNENGLIFRLKKYLIKILEK